MSGNASLYAGGMKITSLNELRRTLGATIDSVTDDREPVLIVRGRGRPPAVLMAMEDFESYEETRHLLGNPVNAERLLAATRDLDGGGGERRDLVD